MNRVNNLGKVKINYLNSNPQEVYSDGDAENDLLNLYTKKNPKATIDNILKNNPSWVNYYHLSPVRGAVIDWFKFKEGSTVLEIGAGPGAVTEALVKNNIHVSALELTERRALINAHRNKNSNNLEVIVGNLEDLPSENLYDYVVCIGVLEYAGTFIEHPDPYHAFLKYIKSHLKQGGQLLLAIENRNGLKYWAGAKEDHTGHVFDGINNYPNKKVRTFGRIELENLFRESGYLHTNFYYPFPDYKHPKIIYSDEYYPGNGTEFPLGMLPTPVPGQSRSHLFLEAFAMMSLESNNMFPQFSNSFIVVGSNV